MSPAHGSQRVTDKLDGTVSPHGARSVAANITRLEPPRRAPGIDLARGLAVLGMFAAHLMLIDSMVWSEPRTWLGIVEGRSAILFATLAGVSLALLGRRAVERSPRNPVELKALRRSIMIRAILIWALGLLLLGFEVPVYIVLPTYGLLLLIGAGLITWRARTLFVLAAGTAIVMPLFVAVINRNGDPEPETAAEGIFYALGWNYPFIAWVAFIAVGLGAGKVLLRGLRHTWLVLGLGVVLAVVGYGVLGPMGNAVVDPYAPQPLIGTGQWMLGLLQDEPHSTGIGEMIGSGGFALAVIAACCLVSSTWFRWVVWPIRVLGSMPLTAYTAHLVVWGLWILMTPEAGVTLDPLNGFRALEPFWPMTLGITLGCIAWTLALGTGPLERLLRHLANISADSSAAEDSTSSTGGTESTDGSRSTTLSP